MDENSDADLEVIEPHFVVRNLHDPIPELSFQVYHHPDYPLWMYTPCKRIPAFLIPEIFLTGVPLQDPTPHWAEDLHRWSREYGQHSPYVMCQEFYDLHNNGSTDRALPAMICPISSLGEDARVSTPQILDVGATDEFTASRFPCLDEDHDHTNKIIDCILEDVMTARFEVRELMDKHSKME
ncbi:unnamed protein product [Lactuca saligna]|uniref:Uncharacterized protein n=1 Tax=Lactuca saligna TaxID=75948 RepID=A0AA35Z3B9_LACSI|nr:unnamed protein product [Lactuca saligna]